MNPTPVATPPRDPDNRERLSVLWIFATANWIVCDVLSIMDPAFFRTLAGGGPPELPVTAWFLLAAALVLEIPIAMILLSRILDERLCRAANLAAGATMALVQVASFLFGTAPTPHYVFLSAVEIGACTAIVRVAWRWRGPSSVP